MIALIQSQSNFMPLFELADRWAHFVAGVVWIGILYFFNWVNSAFAPTMDAETKRKVVPELLPRALWWFRWGAAVTWITGVLLMFIVYYSPLYGYLLQDGTQPELGQWLPAFAALIVGFLVYNALFRLLTKQHAVAVLVWGALAVGFAWVLRQQLGFSGRAVVIHVAALFGTAMAGNVWMLIWPAQRRIITAVKNGQAPDPRDVATAGQRSKHNTYMSVPLLFFMIATGQPATYTYDVVATVAVVLVIAFGVTWLLYAKAKTVRGF